VPKLVGRIVDPSVQDDGTGEPTLVLRPRPPQRTASSAPGSAASSVSAAPLPSPGRGRGQEVRRRLLEKARAARGEPAAPSPSPASYEEPYEALPESPPLASSVDFECFAQRPESASFYRIGPCTDDQLHVG
jgi:hypothetical protein